MLAAQNTNTSVMQHLYKTVDINKQNKNGDTELMLAVKSKTNIDSIQYLCDTFKDTIDINKQNNNGDTVLMIQ